MENTLGIFHNDYSSPAPVTAMRGLFWHLNHDHLMGLLEVEPTKMCAPPQPNLKASEVSHSQASPCLSFQNSSKLLFKFSY